MAPLGSHCGLRRAYIAKVELACAIQKGLALVHGAARPKPLSARAVVDVAGRIYTSKVAAPEKVPSSRFDLSNTGICGAIPFSSSSQFSIGAAP